MLTNSLMSRILVFMTVALVPAVAVQTYNELNLRRTREAHIRQRATDLAKLAAAEQQQIVNGIHQVLIAMSELPAVKARDGAACNAYLTAMQQRLPAFLTFLVTDIDGHSFCNSDRRPISIANRPYFARVLRTGGFTIGEYSVGLSNHRNVIQFALPYFNDNGSIGGVVEAGLSLDWLAGYVARDGVPEGAAVAITDMNGIYIARYPNGDRFVGHKMSGNTSLEPSLRAPADAVGEDGVDRIVGQSVLLAGSGGMLVSFGLDKMRAFAEIERRTWHGAALISLGTILMLLLTWLGARRAMLGPLGQVVEAANQWRLGNYSPRVAVRDKSEIGRVADAFNTMADALAHRDRDLSEAREYAESAAARINTIFESTTDSVIVVETNWRITYLNQRARSQISRTGEVVGLTLQEVFNEAEASDIFRRLEQVMADRIPLAFEAVCANKQTWYALNVFPSECGLTLYFHDITEQKQAQEARRVMEEQLHQSQKMEAVGQLTGGIAHDFNNLLTVVSSNLERIDDHAADPDKVRQLAAAARQAAERGAELTGQLLAFSRRQRLNPKPVSTNQLIREFQGLIRRAVGEGCEIKLLTEERLWPCHLDAAQLQTALLNLALNARDAMPDGGVLTFETRNVVLAEGNAYVSLSVADTGTGMTPDVRDRAFEPFFTTKQVGKGTGLGLSMVYGFVHQSGGHVAIDSTVGVGTTVTLYLPKATQMPEAGMKIIQTQALPAGSERLLLVEDDDALLDVTSDMLTELGYQVVGARTGAEAIQILETDQDFALLLTDVVMPSGTNGIELAQQVRRMNATIKILITSGYAEDVLERHGAVDEFEVIGKPFRRAELAQRLRSILADTP